LLGPKHFDFSKKPQDDKKQSAKDKDQHHLRIDSVNLDTFENASVTEKKAEASIWLAKNFPMKFDVIFFYQKTFCSNIFQ